LLLQERVVPNPAGIQFTATATAPAGGAGQLALIQLSNPDWTRLRAGNPERCWDTRGTEVVDDGNGGFQYGGAQSIAAGATLTLTPASRYADTPGARIDWDPAAGTDPGVSRVVIKDRFRTFLMYRPDKPNAIFVTLLLLEWRWHGEAAANDTTWKSYTLTFGWPGRPAPGTPRPTITGTPSTELPQWSDSTNKHKGWTPA
jgi:hypothetical protein